MNKPLNTFFKLNKNTKICNICNNTFYLFSDFIPLFGRFPRIRVQLFNAKREPFALFINIKDDGLNHISFLINSAPLKNRDHNN